jgi:hypothetical protein
VLVRMSEGTAINAIVVSVKDEEFAYEITWSMTQKAGA